MKKTFQTKTNLFIVKLRHFKETICLSVFQVKKSSCKLSVHKKQSKIIKMLVFFLNFNIGKIHVRLEKRELQKTAYQSRKRTNQTIIFSLCNLDKNN